MPCLADKYMVQNAGLLRRCIVRQLAAGSISNVGSCMKLSEMVEFERFYKLRLPEYYRVYLLHIANGMELHGPVREIMRFGTTPFNYPLGYSTLLNSIHKPFPYETMRVDDDENQVINRIGNERLLTAVRARLAQIGGYITLGSSQNSVEHFFILICEGSCRGEVWIVTWIGSFYPCTPRMTFKDWLIDSIEFSGRKSEQSLNSISSYPQLRRVELGPEARLFQQGHVQDAAQEDEPALALARRGATVTFL